MSYTEVEDEGSSLRGKNHVSFYKDCVTAICFCFFITPYKEKTITTVNLKEVLSVEHNHDAEPQYKVAGFFSGVGGIERAFAQAGWNVVWSNEIDRYAVKTLRANVDHQVVERDIYKVDAEEVPDIDAIVGGFPCQAFSIAGEQRGFDDERGVVFFRLVHMIKAKQPRVLCLENVSNLQTHDKGRTYAAIKDALEELGYKLHALILNSTEYGNVPQNRKRIYICGFRDERDWRNFVPPQPLRLTTSISELIDFNQEVAEKYYYTPAKHAYYPELEQGVSEMGKVYQWRRKYVRANKSNVCPTLTANMGVGGNNVPIIRTAHGIRKLTPRECFRLQGFANDFVLRNLADSHLYKQAGNSVVIPVVRAVAQALLEAMRRTDRMPTAAPEVAPVLPSLQDMYTQVMEQLPLVLPQRLDTEREPLLKSCAMAQGAVLGNVADIQEQRELVQSTFSQVIGATSVQELREQQAQHLQTAWKALGLQAQSAAPAALSESLKQALGSETLFMQQMDALRESVRAQATWMESEVQKLYMLLRGKQMQAFQELKQELLAASKAEFARMQELMLTENRHLQQCVAQYRQECARLEQQMSQLRQTIMEKSPLLHDVVEQQLTQFTQTVANTPAPTTQPQETIDAPAAEASSAVLNATSSVARETVVLDSKKPEDK